MTVVVDSSALMALVLGEPGADEVAEVLPDALVSTVIYVECLSKLAGRGRDVDLISAQFQASGLQVIDVGLENAARVVSLHALARQNVSLADRFCLALALDRDLPVVTADRPWAKLGLPLELRFIR